MPRWHGQRETWPRQEACQEDNSISKQERLSSAYGGGKVGRESFHCARNGSFYIDPKKIKFGEANIHSPFYSGRRCGPHFTGATHQHQQSVLTLKWLLEITMLQRYDVSTGCAWSNGVRAFNSHPSLSSPHHYDTTPKDLDKAMRISFGMDRTSLGFLGHQILEIIKREGKSSIDNHYKAWKSS
ncbi:hypothetical protein RND71_031963 [Anisodus tanguticus]|uniref:Uncharacterized protein n=1 Tax=Anisodus tanguticus TaxID=243964 RepID=A0AAE1UXY9_9SOLA|nr:hypothetical protein RND71_031963 [Anisodus tanguticus]